MNWQFFATAGVISVVLFIISLFLGFFELFDFGSWDFQDLAIVIASTVIIIIVVFWFVVGTISLLSLIWGWGLVV